MYDALKALTAALLMPLPVLLATGLLGGVLLWWGKRGFGAGLLALSGLALALVSWAPVADGLLGPLETQYPAVQAPAEGVPWQAVVVLGHGWAPDTPRPAGLQLSQSAALRLFEGLRLLKQLPDATLVVSGGSRDDTTRPMAEGYRDAAIAMGVAPERIAMLDTPLDTGDEAKALAAWLEKNNAEPDSRFLLVTSASHMPRSMQHFNRVGLASHAAPAHFRTGQSDPSRLNYWIPSARELRKTERAWYEFLGLVAVRWE